jgi:hypothetical protein
MLPNDLVEAYQEITRLKNELIYFHGVHTSDINCWNEDEIAHCEEKADLRIQIEKLKEQHTAEQERTHDLWKADQFELAREINTLNKNYELLRSAHEIICRENVAYKKELNDSVDSDAIKQLKLDYDVLRKTHDITHERYLAKIEEVRILTESNHTQKEFIALCQSTIERNERALRNMGDLLNHIQEEYLKVKAYLIGCQEVHTLD